MPEGPTKAGREGSLEAPTRHALAWQEPQFYDHAALDKELERIFDICHGCRRCFNPCDSFPRLFDLIDASPTASANNTEAMLATAAIMASNTASEVGILSPVRC